MAYIKIDDFDLNIYKGGSSLYVVKPKLVDKKLTWVVLGILPEKMFMLDDWILDQYLEIRRQGPINMSVTWQYLTRVIRPTDDRQTIVYHQHVNQYELLELCYEALEPPKIHQPFFQPI